MHLSMVLNTRRLLVADRISEFLIRAGLVSSISTAILILTNGDCAGFLLDTTQMLPCSLFLAR